MIEDGRVCFSMMTITGWTVSRIVLVITSSYRWRYNWDHQLPPYSEVIRSLDDQRNMSFFFFLAVGALGVLLPHWLLRGGVAHIVATCLPLIGWWVLFSVKPFQISRTFQGKSFNLCFSLLTSSLSFLRLVFLTSRLCILLLVFLVPPLFSGTPFFYSLSFLSFICIPFSCAPIFLFGFCYFL